MYTRIFRAVALVAILSLSSTSVFAQRRTPLIAVSADIVEIAGNTRNTLGFAWNTMFDFSESTISGVLKIGEFQRTTALATTLNLLETEGKSQMLSNPKILAKSGAQAQFLSGGQVPIPYVNREGVGADMKKYGVILETVPFLPDERKDEVELQVSLEVSNPDYSRATVINGTTVPSITTRQLSTHVVLKSGETLVLSGIKQTSREYSVAKVPFLGYIPLIGLLFTTRDITEEQRSLFIFITVEVVR